MISTIEKFSLFSNFEFINNFEPSYSRPYVDHLYDETISEKVKSYRLSKLQETISIYQREFQKNRWKKEIFYQLGQDESLKNSYVNTSPKTVYQSLSAALPLCRP